MKILKTITLSLIVFVSIQVNANWKRIKGNGNVITETRTTLDYEKITIGGSFDIVLVDGNEGELSIKIEDNLSKYLITEVKEGTLKVRWKKGVNVRTRKGVKITIPFKQINAISLAGSGKIVTKNVISSQKLVLKIAGSGNLDLDVKTTELITKIAGSGEMNLNGNTTKLVCKIAGSGDLDSYSLTTQNLEAKITGSGTLKATVNDKISARITGSGKIYYKGNATSEKVKITGSGSITQK